MPIPLLASNWVNADNYHPVPYEQKDIDILMIANFGAYKRHHALFRALRNMPQSVRVRLIGTYNGERTSQVLMAEARSYGVEKRFELLESTSDENVLDSLVRSKISLILSRREGSCVAVVESFFANTPVGIYHDAVIGSRRYINEHTGRFLQHDNLAEQLMEFIANARHYAPRKWALENRIDCQGSTTVLNGILKKHALANGCEWTQDIAAHHWRPDPLLVNPSDLARMRPDVEDIQKRFGVRIG